MGMLYHIDHTNTTHQITDAVKDAFSFSGGGDEITLDVNSTISTTGAGKGISGAVNGTAAMTLNGTVWSSDGTAISTEEGGQTITIGSTGIVSGKTKGIILGSAQNGDGGNSVTNTGLIMSLLGEGIRAEYSNNSVSNSSSIIGNIGIWLGTDVSNSNNQVFNAEGATILGRSGGVFIFGNLTSASPDDSSLENHGTIRVTGASGATAVALFGETSGKTKVENTGTIQGGQWAIHAGDADDTVVNTGLIAGNIDLGKGADLYDGRGGMTFGQIGLGLDNDTFYGGGGAETVDGGDGADTLDGGFGNDELDGNAGNDTVAFSGSVAAIANLASGKATGYGTDTLSNIENLSGGAGADHFTGDHNANSLTGNDGNDTLDGGDGDDSLDGGEGIDTVAFSGSVGATVVLRSLIDAAPIIFGQNTGYGADILKNIENLSGGTGHDSFTGNEGSNVLDGGMGNDTLNGGEGSDTVLFSGSVAAIANLALGTATGYGTDKLISIENLTGGSGADRFTGSSGANTLIGNAGKDKLSAGLGNDKLTGGTQADIFVFNTKLNKTSNVDMISDFKRVDDSFQLDNAIFKKLGSGSTSKPGKLNKDFLAFGSKAKDKNDYLVYDKTKGYLYYDADCSGKGAAVLFAKVSKGLVIDYRDFFVI
jgi:hypothetical protein